MRTFLIGLVAVLFVPIFGQVGLQRQDICLEWVEPFWEFLTLKELRDADINDFYRMFNLMDSSGNGEVSSADFVEVWQTITMMTDADSEAVFQLWVQLGDTQDAHLFMDDMDNVFEYYDTSKNQLVSKEEYTDTWEQDLDYLPNKGCPEFGSLDKPEETNVVLSWLLRNRRRLPENN